MKELEHLPSDNPSEAASTVGETLSRNKASAKAVQGGDTPSGDGKPAVKRAAVSRSQPRGPGGKFTKKKPSDTVKKPQNTDNNTEQPKPKPQAEPVTDGDGDGFVRVPTDPQPEQQRTGVSMGPEAGRVISDGIFNFAQKRGGEKWKPTDSEREMVGKAAAGATDGRHVPWWLALVLAVGFYAMARIGLDKAKKESGKNGVNEHSDNRSDTKRKDSVRKEDGWAFAGKF